MPKNENRHAHICPTCRSVFFCWCEAGWKLALASCGCK